MITKLFRLVTCCKELSPIYMHDISTEWSRGVTWHIKYISPPGEDVSAPHYAWCKLSVRGSKTWPFEVTWLFEKSVSTFTRFIANKLGRLLTLGRIFSKQTLKSSATSCWIWSRGNSSIYVSDARGRKKVSYYKDKQYHLTKNKNRNNFFFLSKIMPTITPSAEKLHLTHIHVGSEFKIHKSQNS